MIKLLMLIVLGCAVIHYLGIGLDSLQQSLFPRREISPTIPWEECFRRAVRIAKNPQAIIDRNGIILECSVPFAQTIGALSTSRCIGQSIDQYHADPDAHRQLRQNNQIDITDRPVILNCHDGTCRSLILNIMILHSGLSWVTLEPRPTP